MIGNQLSQNFTTIFFTRNVASFSFDRNKKFPPYSYIFFPPPTLLFSFSLYFPPPSPSFLPPLLPKKKARNNARINIYNRLDLPDSYAFEEKLRNSHLPFNIPRRNNYNVISRSNKVWVIGSHNKLLPQKLFFLGSFEFSTSITFKPTNGFDFVIIMNVSFKLTSLVV